MYLFKPGVLRLDSALHLRRIKRPQIKVLFHREVRQGRKSGIRYRPSRQAVTRRAADLPLRMDGSVKPEHSRDRPSRWDFGGNFHLQNASICGTEAKLLRFGTELSGSPNDYAIASISLMNTLEWTSTRVRLIAAAMVSIVAYAVTFPLERDQRILLGYDLAIMTYLAIFVVGMATANGEVTRDLAEKEIVSTLANPKVF
jgi:hypothetical protein